MNIPQCLIFTYLQFRVIGAHLLVEYVFFKKGGCNEDKRYF